MTISASDLGVVSFDQLELRDEEVASAAKLAELKRVWQAEASIAEAAASVQGPPPGMLGMALGMAQPG